MLPSRLPPTKFGESAPYERNGTWYVLITIDSATQMERKATEDEIPKPVAKAKTDAKAKQK